MNHLSIISCFFIALSTLVCVNLVNNASIGGNYKKFVGDQGLYKESDDVEILAAGNFKDAVFGSKYAWLVEFYNSYCGFCQKFAPGWKKFASSVKHWRDLVKVAAIDCAIEANTGLCREFEVMGYPSLRYFHEDFKEGTYGAYMDRGTTEQEHKNDLLNKILNEQLEGRAKQFPNLLPYNYTDTSRIFDNTTETKYGLLIVQEPNSHLGMEVTLDLHRLPEIVTRYAYSSNTELANHLGATLLPTTFIITKDNSVRQNMPIQKDREGIVKSIIDELKLYSKYYELILNADKQEFDSQRNQKIKNNHDELLEKVKKMGDVVYQMDLETALRYSLKREVGGAKDITGEKLEALVRYLDILQRHFPFGRNGKILLTNINDYVRTANPVEGKSIFDMVKAAEQEDNLVFSSPNNWLGCRGSSQHFRGYPCGLWKMFHYLVVNAADSEIRGSNPRVGLDAMHGYIKNFFGCTDCSQHFQEMAKRRELEKVSTFNDSILWLWMAHNEVNNRLHGEITEDPEFPKIQFPSKERCSKCHNQDDSWNSTEVLHYLKHMYSSVNIKYLGSDTRVIHLGLGGDNYSNTTNSEGLQAEDVQIQTRPPREGVVKSLETRRVTSGALSMAMIKDKELMLFNLLLCGEKVLTFLLRFRNSQIVF